MTLGGEPGLLPPARSCDSLRVGVQVVLRGVRRDMTPRCQPAEPTRRRAGDAASLVGCRFEGCLTLRYQPERSSGEAKHARSEAKLVTHSVVFGEQWSSPVPVKRKTATPNMSTGWVVFPRACGAEAQLRGILDNTISDRRQG